MLRVLLLTGLAALTLIISAHAASTMPTRPDFIGAPQGNDQWSGQLKTPNRQHTDGPFATISRAQAAVRALRKRQPQRHSPILVQVRGGTYYLKAPLVFTPDDSGTATSPTLYTATPHETPIFSGGERLLGWKTNAKGQWQLQLPDVADGKWNFIQLFVDGTRRSRPKLPKTGFFTITENEAATPQAQGKGDDSL